MARWKIQRCRGECRRDSRGIVLLALLIAMVLLGIGLMAATDVWSVTRQREREQDLLFAGEQYRQAIRRYYLGAPPGTPRVLPANFDVLLEDDRYPIPVRHLRRAYPDPITGKSDWGMIKVNERIVGVFSLSEARPLKQAGFLPPNQGFKDAESYRAWVFAMPIPATRLAAPVIPPGDNPAAAPADPAILLPPMPARRKMP